MDFTGWVMRSLVPSEQDESIALVEFCKGKKILCIHVPNGMHSSAKEGARMKRMGMAKGFPDFFFPYARNGRFGLFIELKRKTGGYLSPAQQEWLDLLNNAGYLAIKCLGWEDAARNITLYLEEQLELDIASN